MRLKLAYCPLSCVTHKWFNILLRKRKEMANTKPLLVNGFSREVRAAACHSTEPVSPSNVSVGGDMGLSPPVPGNNLEEQKQIALSFLWIRGSEENLSIQRPGILGGSHCSWFLPIFTDRHPFHSSPCLSHVLYLLTFHKNAVRKGP